MAALSSVFRGAHDISEGMIVLRCAFQSGESSSDRASRRMRSRRTEFPSAREDGASPVFDKIAKWGKTNVWLRDSDSQLQRDGLLRRTAQGSACIYQQPPNYYSQTLLIILRGKTLIGWRPPSTRTGQIPPTSQAASHQAS
jgi:hypothetical protein